MDSLINAIAHRNSSDMQMLRRYEREEVGFGEDCVYRLGHLAQATMIELTITFGAALKVLGSLRTLMWADSGAFKWMARIGVGMGVIQLTADAFAGRLLDQFVPIQARDHFVGAFSPTEALKAGAQKDIQKVTAQVVAIARVVIAGMVALALAASLIILAEISAVWAVPAALLVGGGLALRGIAEIQREGIPGTLESRSHVLEIVLQTASVVTITPLVMRYMWEGVSAKLPAEGPILRNIWNLIP